MSDKQRKAMFAKRGKGAKSSVSFSIGKLADLKGAGKGRVMSMGRFKIGGTSEGGFFRSPSKKEVADMSNRHSKLRKLVAMAVKKERKYTRMTPKERKKHDWSSVRGMGKTIITTPMKSKASGKKRLVQVNLSSGY